MRVGTLVGLILIVAGIVALVVQQVSVTRERQVLRAGPLEVSAERRETFTIPTVLAGVSIAAGIALVIAVRRAAK